MLQIVARIIIIKGRSSKADPTVLRFFVPIAGVEALQLLNFLGNPAIALHETCLRKAPITMASLFSGAFDHLRTTVGYFAWDPATSAARRVILSVLHKITIGQLVIEEKGVTTLCGTSNLAVGSPPLPATVLHIKNDAFWTRVALFADMVCGCL